VISRSVKILADENVQGDVIAFLRSEDFDILASKESLPEGTSDAEILQFAFRERRIILTHDRDFSTLALAEQQPLFALLYVRPGHIRAEFTIETLRALLELDEIVLEPSCIIVAERHSEALRVRVRRW
jgi:predicted nuclease of predicted toxin-antitoxin system